MATSPSWRRVPFNAVDPRTEDPAAKPSDGTVAMTRITTSARQPVLIEREEGGEGRATAATFHLNNAVPSAATTATQERKTVPLQMEGRKPVTSVSRSVLTKETGFPVPQSHKGFPNVLLAVARGSGLLVTTWPTIRTAAGDRGGAGAAIHPTVVPDMRLYLAVGLGWVTLLT